MLYFKKENRMPKIFQTVLIFILLSVSSFGFADSPITSTDFHRAYSDNKLVQHAAKIHSLDPQLMLIIAENKTPLDVKLAIINAASWSIDGKNSAYVYMDFLSETKGLPEDFTLEMLSADNLTVIGYMMAMDNYAESQPALRYLTLARKKNPDSFSVAMILAIVEAQSVPVKDWCERWRIPERVLSDKKLKRDMRPQAVDIIIDYMILYKKYCEKSPARF